MIEVFRSRDSVIVGHLQSLLESEGIETYFRNEHVANTAIAISEFTPVLCILDEAEVDRGGDLIRDYLGSSTEGVSADQTCSKCGETSPGAFAACWKCGAHLDS